jgi:hypothetical protein
VRGAPTDRQKERRAEAISCVAPHQKFAAVEEIGGVSGEEEEDEAGGKLSQAYISEIEGAPGDFVDLPSYGYGLHLQRYDYEEAR